MNRRITAAAVVLVAGVLALSGCSAPKAAPSSTTSSGGTPDLKGATIVFAGPAGSLGDGLVKCVITPFEQKTGATVTFVQGDLPQNLAKEVAQKGSPSVDVNWGTDSDAVAGQQQGVFAKLPTAQIPNLANVTDENKSKDGYSIAVATGIMGIQYNTQVFKDHGWKPPTSFEDLWDPKYKGHVAIYDIATGPGQALFQYINKQEGGSFKDSAPGFKKFEQLKPNLYQIVQSGAQEDQAFQAGSDWIGYQAPTRTQPLIAAGQPVDFVQPKKGAIPYHDLLSVVKGAPNPTGAAAFINFALSKPAQECLPGAVGWAGTIKGLPAFTKDQARFFAGGGAPVVDIDYAGIQNVLADWVNQWNRQIAAK